MEKTVKKIKVRGTGTYDPETQKFGFEPFNEGPSTQTHIKNCAGGGKRWVTTGSDPSKMISLKSKESSADQYADFVSQFDALTKDLLDRRREERDDLHGHRRPLTSQPRLASRGAASGAAGSSPSARLREIQQSNKPFKK